MKIGREGRDQFYHRITEYGDNVSSKQTVQHVRHDANGPITTTNKLRRLRSLLVRSK